uniref:Carbamoyl phosphate synthase small chain n=1 Tax=Caloglossa beccarii TaxID=131038 RepID=A0A1Z1M7Y3_9FLOR|nr:carbamoyl phosphate synthase small subunit [Caloglossa beccarii]ARW62198.1 carbamoyl phosphate synthase small subunit [Caloglossa beccarii]
MITSSLCQAFLHLDNGVMYKGWSFVQNSVSFGELVFNTGMTGYQEIITDPSYSNQIVVFTYPELGNTGLNEKDNESNLIHVKGIVAKNCCLYPSNWQNKISLKEFIINKKIPHIFGIDTRSLTRHLRSQGVMCAYILHKPIDQFVTQSYINFLNLDLVKRITKSNVFLLTKKNILGYDLFSYVNKKKAKEYKKEKKTLNIILIDFGCKNNIIAKLLDCNCNIYVLPATANYKFISIYKPDGIILSNGPGDPSLVSYAIQTIKKLIYFSNIPMFGICMGHQLLNLALGGSTFKLKFGHRGLNHPSGINQFSDITSQNHGFAVELSDLNKTNVHTENVFITYLNLNDQTIGGIIHNYKPIFSVQHHPEASPGPHDSNYLFQFFIELIYKLKYYKY